MSILSRTLPTTARHTSGSVSSYQLRTWSARSTWMFVLVYSWFYGFVTNFFRLFTDPVALEKFLKISSEVKPHCPLSFKFFNESDNAVFAFIGMFLSCDGFVSDFNKCKRREVSFGLGSEQLIDDLQIVLQQYGILSSKRYKISNGFDSWVLDVCSNKSNFIHNTED